MHKKSNFLRNLPWITASKGAVCKKVAAWRDKESSRGSRKPSYENMKRSQRGAQCCLWQHRLVPCVTPSQAALSCSHTPNTSSLHLAKTFRPAVRNAAKNSVFLQRLSSHWHRGEVLFAQSLFNKTLRDSHTCKHTVLILKRMLKKSCIKDKIVRMRKLSLITTTFLPFYIASI